MPIPYINPDPRHRSASIVGWWKMEDDGASTTVTDDKGSNDGTADRNTNLLSAVGKIGDALTFNGTTDWMPSNMSVSFWVKTDNTGGADIVCGWNEYYFISLQADQINLFRAVSAGTKNECHFTATGVKNGSWHHVLMVIPNTTTQGSVADVRCWMDGKELTQSSEQHDAAAVSFLRFTAGDSIEDDDSGPVGTFPLDGALDDLRLYNALLHMSACRWLYNRGSGQSVV